MDRHAEPRSDVCERRGDIVAVADVGDRATLTAPPALPQRQHVRQGLARVLLIAQGVDDVQPWRRRSEDGYFLVSVGPNHQRGDPALEVSRDILERFARAI